MTMRLDRGRVLLIQGDIMHLTAERRWRVQKRRTKHMHSLSASQSSTANGIDELSSHRGGFMQGLLRG